METEISTWLEKHKSQVISRWLNGVVDLSLPHYVHLSAEELALEVAPFFDYVVRGLRSGETSAAEEGDHLKALSDWMLEQRMKQGCTLQELLGIVVQLRSTIGLLLLEQGDLQRTVQWWQRLVPFFDQVTIDLADLFTQAIEETLLERVQDAEMMASSLAAATEEADQALMRLRAMYDMARTIGTTLSVRETGERIVERLARITRADHCVLWLRRGEHLQAEAAQGLTQELTALSVPLEPNSHLGHALSRGHAIVLDGDTPLAPADRLLLQLLGRSGVLVAPLVIQDEAIGLVTLNRASPTPTFERAEIDLIESVAQQAAVAIKNAQLYEEIQALNRELEDRIAQRTRELAEEKERLEALYTIAQELSVSLDLDKVLEKTLTTVSAAVGASHGSIMLLDPASETLIYRAVLGRDRPLPPGGEPTPFKPGVGLAGWVIQHKQPVLSGDVRRDPRWLDSASPRLKTRSIIAVPLMVGNDVHGVLIVSDARPNYFNEAHLKLVTAAAGQVARAINNAELYRYVREQAERLGVMLRREQEESSKNQAILASIADGVLVNDAQGRIILVNAAAARILNSTEEALLGQNVRNVFAIFSPSGRREALEAMDAFMSASTATGQEATTIETVLEMDQRVVSAHLAPVITANDEFLGVVTVLRDITKEVEADRAKSEFVSTVSHELRTPLTSIKGYTDLLIAGAVGEINEQQKRFLNIIKSNADRLTALINDLLDISRIETGRIQLNMEPLRMEEIVLEVVNSLRRQIEEKGLTLELDIPPGLREVYGDRDRLTQVLTNLVSNAYHYTPSGSIRISLSQVEDVLRVDVADTGIGISPEDQKRIFDRFFRADHPVVRESRGTGLGLSIVKMFVEMHGGRIWVESEPGKGSTFTFILPTTPEALPISPEELPISARVKTILVVDDERDIVDLLRHQLEPYGYRVISTGLGKEVVPLAEKEHPDLITLDILLPDQDGFEVLRELKANPATKDIPVIVLSVVPDAESGLRLGAIDYIVKPIDEDRLLSSVQGILARKGRVLVAEDDADTAELLQRLLGREGFEVLWATNGYEALAIARREQPELILMDLRMPGMDGYEAITRLKQDEATQDIPVIAMSAHALDEDMERERLLDMGAVNFLAKPFSVEQLISEIQHCLTGNGHTENAAAPTEA